MADNPVPGELYKVRYPDFFPCPTWAYAQEITEFLNRTTYDSGWTRQRRRWNENGAALDLQFVMNTKTYGPWSRWVEANGHDWFTLYLDRFDGRQILYEVRFTTDLITRYDSHDIVTVSVTAQIGGNLSGTAGGTEPWTPGNPEGLPDLPTDGPEYIEPDIPYVVYPECQPYACDAFRAEILKIYNHAWAAEDATDGQLLPLIGDDNLDIDLAPIYSYFTPDPVLQDGCYTSWRRNGSGSGNDANGAYKSYTVGDSGAFNMQMLARHTGTTFNGGSPEFLQMTLQFRRTDTLAPFNARRVKLDLTSEYTGNPYNPGLVHSVNFISNGNVYPTIVDWEDKYLDPISYFLSVTWNLERHPTDVDWWVMTWDITSNVGVSHHEDVFYRPFYGVEIYQMDIEFGGGNDVRAYIHTLSADGVAIDFDDVSDILLAIERNYEDYEPPAWCPGPKP